MASDSRIPMMGQTIDTATPINQAHQQQMNDRLTTEQTLKAHYERLDAREKSRLTNTVAGAAQLKTFLDQDDLEGAHTFLVQRRNALQTRIGQGENLDTQETDEALRMLRGGEIDQLKNGVAGLMAAGQVYGIVGESDMPSDARTAMWYNNAPQAYKDAFDATKRATQFINLGDKQIQIMPGGAPGTQYPINPAPEDMPGFKKDAARAAAEGTAEGETNAGVGTRIAKSSGLLVALEDLKTSAAAAPSGVVEGLAATLSNKAGKGGPAAKAQGDFSVKRAAAENAIRETFRVVGSGATSDRDALPFIQMLPEASDSEDVKIAKTAAASAAVKATTRALAASRNLADPFPESAAGGNTVVIVNPQTGEQFELDGADTEALTAAQQEGFVVQ